MKKDLYGSILYLAMYGRSSYYPVTPILPGLCNIDGRINNTHEPINEKTGEVKCLK